MRYVIFNGEKNVNDLAARVFAIQGPNAASATSQAAATLMKANPQLSDLSKLPAGSLIAVPDNAPALATAGQSVATGELRALGAQTVQTAAATLQQRLATIETSAASRLTLAMTLLQTANTKTGIQNLSSLHPELVKQLPDLDAVAKDAAGFTASVQSAQDLRKQSLSRLTTTLAGIVQKS
jgi:DNA-binding transcriptional regulator YbjK